ncbi:MAG: response regulator, partial [Deltaproteobacteria bacterium]|nr:response regulator [Deltaproteobacteria bacterium]
RSLTSYLIESGKPLLTTPDNFDQICQTNDIAYIGTQPTSWLGVPFYLEHMSGAVVVQSYDEIIYSEKDKNLLIYVARHVGDALARKKSIDDLRRSKTKAETAEKNKSAFLANMSHEIRTPMNGIIGITDLLLDSEITDKQYTYLTMVRSSADRLLNLVNDILDFSKIEAGKLELQIEPFKLRETLTETLSILELNAVKKGILLDAHINTDVPDHLNGDPNRLCQVLLNLVQNAIKFTDDGEVRVHIECNRQLLLEQEGHSSLHFMVSDTGIGIPEDQQEHIFDAFKQADNIKTGAYEGTGLGLPVTAQLVELMGGRIWLESSPQRGSCFHFTAYFTIFDSNDAEIKKQTSLLKKRPSSSTTPSYNILLAEDDPINQTLAIAILEREGWQVTLAVNGLEVLEKLKKKSYDLVLMDIQMPEMDGLEAARNIREQEQDNNWHQPIVAMTAYALKGDRQKCLDAGMDGYISKPIDTDLLRIEVETVLKQHQPQPERFQHN